MKKKILLLVQVRMGSKRLPKKSILDLAGKPMIFRIIERLKMQIARNSSTNSK